MKESGIVVASFLVIFAFSSVDSSISPMVKELNAHFQVPLDRVLLLISSCTIGTVFGVLVGPAVTASFSVTRLLQLCTLGLFSGLIGFLLADQFVFAQLSRLLFGISSGFLASCMWWLTFYGVEKSHYPAMIAVLMSARPLATALGVPLAGIMASTWGWKSPFWLFAASIALGGVFLTWSLRGRPEGEKQPFSLRRIAADYQTAFRIPYAAAYYAGFTINRMCYFGFYSFSGIWFIHHFQLSLAEISTCLFCIGVVEAVVNFLVPRLLKIVSHRRLFEGSLIVSGIVFPICISGHFSLGATVAMLTLFMLCDRLYCMAMVITIPEMFPDAQNKTVFGSLNTLTAWGGLTLIAWIQGHYLTAMGVPMMQHLLTLCFFVGSALLYYVQYSTVLAPSPAHHPDTTPPPAVAPAEPVKPS
jgi:predicted MFS family arabinose efflux permease